MAHFRYSEILVHAQHTKNRPHRSQTKKQAQPHYRRNQPYQTQGFIQKRPCLLLAGFGDIARRIAQQVGSSIRIIALSRKRPSTQTILWKQTNFDKKQKTLSYPSSGYIGMVYLAPPPNVGNDDPRLKHFLIGLAVKRAVYISTTGVYGNHSDAWIDETHRTSPQTARAYRRKSAEKTFRKWARFRCTQGTILRVPGIFAHNRLPLERLTLRTPALISNEDVYTNHIHADDLARLIWRTLFKGKAQRLYNACDDTHLKMGDYFDRVAKAFHLPYPPRYIRLKLSQHLSPMQYSFMQESRRIKNFRIKNELGFQFHYPNLESWIDEAAQ